MDKQKIEARLAELMRQREKALADFHAVNGAIQDCNYWLARLSADEQSTEIVAEIEVPHDS